MESVTAADWKKPHGFADVLRPFQTATKLAEGEKYLTLSSIIPMLTVLREKTVSYFKNSANNGFGITFAKNLLASIEDRFGRYPELLLKQPYCLATFVDPRYSWMYFKNSRDVERVQESLFEMVKSEMESLPTTETDNAENSSLEFDNFWGTFDETASTQAPGHVSIESEIRMWKGVSRPHRTANPIHAMEGLKRDYPRVYKLFQKYSIFPATKQI